MEKHEICVELLVSQSKCTLVYLSCQVTHVNLKVQLIHLITPIIHYSTILWNISCYVPKNVIYTYGYSTIFLLIGQYFLLYPKKCHKYLRIVQTHYKVSQKN